MRWFHGVISAFGLAAFLGLSGCATMQQGADGINDETSGHAGGANAGGESVVLEKCDATLGTIALVEDIDAAWYQILAEQFKLNSTVPVLKLLAQQSNCFVVVERGLAMDNIMQERVLTEAGELREESSFGKGQMVAADFTLNPTLTFSNKDTGGTIAGIANQFGFWGQIAAGFIAQAQTKEAGTLLTLIDNRSGVQLVIAEGSAKNTDFGVLGAIFGGSGGGAMGAYANTAEGKVIVAALADAYNAVVRAARNYQMQLVQGGLGAGQGEMQVQKETQPQEEASANPPQDTTSENKVSEPATNVAPEAVSSGVPSSAAE